MNDLQNKPILRVQELSVGFSSKESDTTVVDQVSFNLYRGRCMGLVGESGSGKTIASLAAMQLLPHGAFVAANSRILLDDTELLGLTEKQMRQVRGQRIAMIFQDAMSALNPVLTIGVQLLETIRLHTIKNKKAAKTKALSLLEEVGIKDPARCFASYPHQLSGGMRQRVMIAIALSCDPDIIIADEPTTALDVTVADKIIQLLKYFKEKRRCAILFIAHDLSVVKKIADDVTVMQAGRVVESQTVFNFFSAPSHPYTKKLLAALLPIQARKVSHVEKKPVLKVDQLSIQFPLPKKLFFSRTTYFQAVNSVSFSIRAGETMALVGESGSGKTTTAKGVLQLLHHHEGCVEFSGMLLNELSAKALRIAREDMQIIFQDPHAAINPRMLIFDCLTEGLVIQGKIKGRKALESRVDELLELVELPLDAKWRYPHEFSGGQRQRICIARALAVSPKLLVLDEPTSALDVSIQKQILDLLDRLQQQLGLTYLLITHNLSVVAYMAHQVAVMRSGEIVEYGPVADILHAPSHTYTKELMAAI